MPQPFLRTEHNYNLKEVSDETALVCKDQSLTRQEFAQEADINTIIERFGIGYEMPMNTTPPMDGDFTNLPDFTEAVKMVRHAQELFNDLPAKIRNRFQNDPQKYIEFFHDPENRDEAIKLGLVKPPEARAESPAPQPPSPTPPAAAGAKGTPPTP